MLETWAEYIDRVAVHFPLPLEVWALSNPGSPDDVELRAVMHAPNILGGERILVTVVDFPPPLATVADPARYLRTLLLRVLAHELDETLLVDGVKARDPHTEDVHPGAGAITPRCLHAEDVEIPRYL